MKTFEAVIFTIMILFSLGEALKTNIHIATYWLIMFMAIHCMFQTFASSAI